MARSVVRVQATALALSAAVTAVPAAAQRAEPPGPEVRLDLPAGDGRSSRLVAGLLGPPSSDPPERIARAALAGPFVGLDGPVELRAERLVGGPGRPGVVRLRQTFRGVPVLGAAAAVLVDAAGRPRLVVQSLVPGVGLPAEPTLSAEEAVGLARRSGLAAAPSDDPGRAALAYLPTPEGLAPVYVVSLGRVIPLLASYRVTVDATTGEVLGATNRVLADRLALAFAEGPSASTLEPVTLDTLSLDGQGCVAPGSLPPGPRDGLPVDDPSLPRLCTSRVSALSCLDYGGTIVVDLPGYGERELRSCAPFHLAIPNDAPSSAEDPDDEIADDFYYDDVILVDYDYFRDHRMGEDPFSEVHAFHHVERTFEHFRSLEPSSVLGLDSAAVVVSVGWRLPIDANAIASGRPDQIATALDAASDPGSPLYPFDGAFYLPPGRPAPFAEPREPAAIVFFQGRFGESAHDPDVVAHEAAHAVVEQLAGLGETGRDELGLRRFSLALAEGYADYFAAARSGDPVHGERAASVAGSEPRDLSAAPGCEAVRNDPHADSLVWSGALWQARVADGLPETFDRAVLLGLAALLPDSGLGEAAAATLAALELEAGAEAAEAVREIFLSRGFGENGCPRVVDLAEAPGLELVVDGRHAVDPALSPFAPPALQLRVTLERAAPALAVDYDLGPAPRLAPLLPPEGEARLGLLVRAGDEPIRFTTSGAVGAEADGFVAVDEPAREGAPARRFVYARSDGEPLAAGSYHLALVGMGRVSGLVTGISVVPLATLPGGSGPEPEGDFEPWTFPDPSCACAASGRRPGPLRGLLSALLGP